MRLLLTLGILALAVVPAQAADKQATIELAGMKATVPAAWEATKPSNEMRLFQFALPKAEGDKETGEIAVFAFPGGSGSLDANLARQEAKFEIPEGVKKEDAIKVTKLKVGKYDATYQDIQGTYLSKFPPFAPNAKVTKKENYRQLYVVFEDDSGKQYYMTVLGPTKTIEAQKKAFEEMLKSFK
jgi:hypothetical protein